MNITAALATTLGVLAAACAIGIFIICSAVADKDYSPKKAIPRATALLVVGAVLAGIVVGLLN